MEEHLDILDNQGRSTGESQSYNRTHELGLIHRTVHVWIVNSKRQLLLQKRSNNKKAYPGRWDISAAGHISSGETSLEAAKKETREELGLDLLDSAFIFLFSIRQPRIVHSASFIDEEFNDVYIVYKDFETDILKLQVEEVEEIKWIDLSQFRQLLQEQSEFLVPHNEEYPKLLDYITNKI